MLLHKLSKSFLYAIGVILKLYTFSLIENYVILYNFTILLHRIYKKITQISLIPIVHYRLPLSKQEDGMVLIMGIDCVIYTRNQRWVMNFTTFFDVNLWQTRENYTCVNFFHTESIL